MSYLPIENIDAVTPDEMTDEQRDFLIGCLAVHDANEFIDNQGKAARATISDIKGHQKEFDEEGGKIAQDKLNLYISSGTLDAQAIEKIIETAEEESDSLKRKYACQMLGLGNRDLNYCIALQRDACLKANRDTGYRMMPDIGFSCINAQKLFEQENIGHYYPKVSDCYNLSCQTVKHDENGNKKLTDGDLILIIDPQDGQAFHCMRINVDKNDMVTYSSGNGESLSGKLNWVKDYPCYIIPTSEIAEKNAQQHYRQMNNEQLLSEAKKKGLSREDFLKYREQVQQQASYRRLIEVVRSDCERYKIRMQKIDVPEQVIVKQEQVTAKPEAKNTGINNFIINRVLRQR